MRKKDMLLFLTSKEPVHQQYRREEEDLERHREAKGFVMLI